MKYLNSFNESISINSPAEKVAIELNKILNVIGFQINYGTDPNNQHTKEFYEMSFAFNDKFTSILWNLTIAQYIRDTNVEDLPAGSEWHIYPLIKGYNEAQLVKELKISILEKHISKNSLEAEVVLGNKSFIYLDNNEYLFTETIKIIISKLENMIKTQTASRYTMNYENLPTNKLKSLIIEYLTSGLEKKIIIPEELVIETAKAVQIITEPAKDLSYYNALKKYQPELWEQLSKIIDNLSTSTTLGEIGF